VGGKGELDGTPFEQRDYFETLYNPEHHHFSRDFVLLLDGEDRGLAVLYADPFQDDPPVEIALVDRDLTVLETRTVTDESYDGTVE
jgi:hypothetical protein